MARDAPRRLILAVCLAGLAPAGAQEPPRAPEVVDLPVLLRLVRDASPRLAVERQAIAGAEAGRIAAEAYPNPTLSFGRFRPSGGQSGTLFDGNRQSQANLEVPVLIAGQRGARIERADLEIEAARARVASGASSLAAEAGAAYVALLAAQEKVALLGIVNEELARLRNIVAGREASGMASRYDVTRLDVELGGARARLADAQAEVADRAGGLAALLGLRDWRPRAAGPLRPLELGADALAQPRDRVTTSPATVAAAREETAAKSAIDVAQAGAMADAFRGRRPHLDERSVRRGELPRPERRDPDPRHASRAAREGRGRRDHGDAPARARPGGGGREPRAARRA